MFESSLTGLGQVSVFKESNRLLQGLKRQDREADQRYLSFLDLFAVKPFLDFVERINLLGNPTTHLTTSPGASAPDHWLHAMAAQTPPEASHSKKT